jgi:transposase
LRPYDRKEGSQPEIARRFDVSLSFVEKLLRRRRRTGSIEAKPHTGGYAPRLDEAGQEVLRQIVLENKDLTIDEVREQLQVRLGVTLSCSRVGRLLQTLDLPLKKSRFTLRNARRIV